MRTAVDYLLHIKSVIVLNPHIIHWSIVREETVDDTGLFRYRLTLVDGSSLELFERFHIKDGTWSVSKYSFHWQLPDGRLLKRWDNAAHHREIDTFPHHMHEENDDNVLPHHPITAEKVLQIITNV
jgi:hypothetical protein